MNAPAAELKGVFKTFGKGRTRVRALRGVDLTLRAGEVTLIRGPSGSGKTTLLHILGLLLRAESGEVWIEGRRLDTLPESRLADERRGRVVLIFQQQNLLESLTVRQNVAVVQRLRTPGGGLGVDESLQRLGLEDRAGHVPRDLSGGERQRTAIARALACGGRLILADEPTANLDWENARQVLQCLCELAHRDGRAVVLVTHDSRLTRFADRIIQLVDGQIPDKAHPAEMLMSGRTDTPDASSPADAGHKRGAGLGAWISLLLLLALAGAAAVRYLGPFTSATSQPSGPEVTVAPTLYVAAAAAVVEPMTQTVVLRAERPGRITAILKRAGDPIVRGEPLVRLDDAVPRARVAQQQAALSLTEAELAELRAWHRKEERDRAKAVMDQAEARLTRARRELRRIESLDRQNVASRTELAYAYEEVQLATAALAESRLTWEIARAGPTVEQVRVAEAQVAAARAALQLAETDLDRYTIVSPLDGHVIYRHLEPGEVVDPEVPQPILSVGSLDAIRLRAEIDEADIARVFVGQSVVATAQSLNGREITGTVVRLEPIMGRKSIRTERAAEQRDTKVREVLIQLEPDTPTLPIDLQLTVRFIGKPTPTATTNTPNRE